MNSDFLRFDKKKKIVLFDFETFNLCLSFIQNRPWQFAAMEIVGDNVLNTYDYYIRWDDSDLRIGKEAAIITQFNEAHFQKMAKPQEDVFEHVYQLMNDCDYIMAHNGLNFDIYLLRDWCRMHGKKWQHFPSKLIDTNCLAKGVKLDIPYTKGQNLLEYQYKMISIRAKGVKTSVSALGKEFGISHDYENLHNALIDIDLNRKIWNVLKYRVEI